VFCFVIVVVVVMIDYITLYVVTGFVLVVSSTIDGVGFVIQSKNGNNDRFHGGVLHNTDSVAYS
jgi:uncharacterized membrane protein